MISIVIDEAEQLKCEKYSGFIKFEYNANIVNFIRQLPVKMYNVETKTWEIPSSHVDKILTFFKANDFHGSLTDNRELKKTVTNIEYKTTPFSHQILGVEFGLTHDKWFLGDEQGLGKSKQAIDIAINKKNELGFKHCLIVCGVNSLKWNWQNEVSIHSNETAHILGQRTNKKGITKIGSMQNRIDDIKNVDKLPYFLITNVESFRSMDFANAVKDKCGSEIQMCITDEIHKMKNPQSQQTKGFLKVNTEYQLAMTGTPIMNSPLDSYIILRWLGYETHSFYSFQGHYCIKGGFGGYQIIGYKNMEQLTAQLQSIMLRRLKKDVLDLPEKIYVDEIVDMTSGQEKLYKEVLSEVLDNIDKVSISPSPLSALIRLRQCTGYTGILSSEIQESSKLDRMVEIVEDAVANDDKAIIFSNWSHITDEASNRLKQYNPAVITGNTKDNERQTEQNRFTNGKECKVIIGTIGAMGTGLTLTAATTVIFLDEPWNKALFDQAVDRAHRIGTKSNVTIHSILCKNTIDEKIHDLIYKKGAVSSALIDSGESENKTELINYLLS